MRQMKTITLIFAAAVMSAVLGTATTTLASQQLSAAQVKAMVKEGKGCTMPGDVFYGRGAFATNKGQRYQCVEVFGENLTPAGSAWVVAEQ